MSNTYNLFFLIIASYSFFFIVLAYGCVLKKLFFNSVEIPFSLNIFLGIIFLTLAQYLIYFFFEINIYTNLLLIFFGLILCYYNLKKTKYVYIYSVFLILFFLFVVVVKPHDDFHHHLSSVFTYFERQLTFGLYNLDPAYGYQPITVFFQTFLIVPPLNENFFYIYNYIIYIGFIIFLYEIFINNKILNKHKYLVFVIFLFFLIKFDRINEHGNDLPGQIFLLIFFLIFYILDREFKSFDKLILSSIFYILSISIKTPNVILMPMYLFVLFNYFKNNKLKKNIIIKFILISGIFASIVLFNNFQKSGCLLPLASFTCFDVYWGVDLVQQKDQLNYFELDTKGFFNADLHNLKNSDEYLKSYNWLPVWIKTHFFYKVFEFLLIFFTITILLLFIFKRQKKKTIYSKNELSLIFFSFISIAIWLHIFPQVRYFSGGILIFLILTVFNLINYEPIFDRKKVNIIMLFIIIIFNLTNLNKIKNENKKYSKYNIELPLIHYPIIKLEVLREYELLCRTDYKCEYLKDLKINKHRYYNILFFE